MKESELKLHETITINRPPEEVYSYWRHLENLPRFMEHLESVRELDGKRSHWVLKVPAGPRVEWDAEIIEERENEFITWHSLPGSEIETEGIVRFQGTPDRRGTDIEVLLQYSPPGGKAARAAAKVAQPITGQQLKGELKRFKEILEKGKAA